MRPGGGAKLIGRPGPGPTSPSPARDGCAGLSTWCVRLIDREDLAGDLPGRRGGEEVHGAGDVPGGAGPPGTGGGDERLPAVVGQLVAEELRADRGPRPRPRGRTDLWPCSGAAERADRATPPPPRRPPHAARHPTPYPSRLHMTSVCAASAGRRSDGARDPRLRPATVSRRRGHACALGRDDAGQDGDRREDGPRADRLAEQQRAPSQRQQRLQQLHLADAGDAATGEARVSGEEAQEHRDRRHVGEAGQRRGSRRQAGTRDGHGGH